MGGFKWAYFSLLWTTQPDALVESIVYVESQVSAPAKYLHVITLTTTVDTWQGMPSIYRPMLSIHFFSKNAIGVDTYADYADTWLGVDT